MTPDNRIKRIGENMFKTQSEIYFERIKTVSIEGLKAMFSPMFDKHFNEMTDDEIKQQLDLWLGEGTHHNIFGDGLKENREMRRKKR